MVEEHPLLNEIDFQNTSGLIEYLVNTGDKPKATWQTLTAAIVTELTRDFKKIDLSQKKLTAFIPIGKAMLDLGPVWIDRFVRAHLGEAIANGVEDGLIDGDGLLEPVGMNKNLDGAVDQATGYPAKTKVPVTDFSPESYGGLVSQLLIGPNGNVRTVKEVMLIVNPIDYLIKVMPASTQLINGTYVKDIFPFPTRVVQSASLTQGSAILGIGKKYFMGIGTQKAGKIEYSDENRFLEDERVYITKLYGTGRPIDNNSFLYLDISKLKPNFPIVRVRNYYNSDLASIVVAGGTLSPVFDANVTYYEADVAEAGAFTVVAEDAVNATIGIKVNGSAATNGESVTWGEGSNVVVVTVTNGDTVKTYVVVVTYTVEA